MIQDDLLKEFKDEEIFNKVTKHGITYLKEALSRNVYPKEKALSNLNVFHEKLQDEYSPAGDVISKLEEYGSPGTVAQVGGRYFGFVNGGVIPAGLLARLMSDYWDQNTAGAWVHIDGAFGLWAQAVKELRHLTKGMEKATSWSVDGHKTLNTPYDNGIILCSDEEALVSALHMSGAYIVLGEKRDGMFYTSEMSRRARIIELWATMKSLGKKGISELVYGLHQRALQFRDLLMENDFEIINDVIFNQVLVYYRDNDTTKKILKDIQEQRICWCGGSRWNDKDVIRISICSWATTEEDVSISVNSFLNAKKNVLL